MLQMPHLTLSFSIYQDLAYHTLYLYGSHPRKNGF